MADIDLVPRRQLASGVPPVPMLALGSWNIWDRMDFNAAVELIHRAVASGCGFFDVAHYNMGPHAENGRTDLIFGEAVRAAGIARADWLLCGKLWLWDYPATSFTQQMTVSLDRLQVERAELVVVGDYVGELDVERVVTDVTEQIEAGRFAAWGVNNWRFDDVRAAIDIATARQLVPPSFAQLKYSLVRRSMAEGQWYDALFRQGELSLQASDVFEGGLLVGNLQPSRKIGADVGGIRDQIIAAWPAVHRLAADLQTTPAQLGIAFCLANANTANVLLGCSSPAQLSDDLGAFELLQRVGATRLRELTGQLWLDRGVSADGSW